MGAELAEQSPLSSVSCCRPVTVLIPPLRRRCGSSGGVDHLFPRYYMANIQLSHILDLREHRQGPYLSHFQS